MTHPSSWIAFVEVPDLGVHKLRRLRIPGHTLETSVVHPASLANLKNFSSFAASFLKPCTPIDTICTPASAKINGENPGTCLGTRSGRIPASTASAHSGTVTTAGEQIVGQIDSHGVAEVISFEVIIFFTIAGY